MYSIKPSVVTPIQCRLFLLIKKKKKIKSLSIYTKLHAYLNSQHSFRNSSDKIPEEKKGKSSPTELFFLFLILASLGLHFGMQPFSAGGVQVSLVASVGSRTCGLSGCVMWRCVTCGV